MEIKNIIIAPKRSEKCWANGAYTLCFVYSNKGNLLVKGYMGDVELVLNELKTKGYKFYYNKVMFHHGDKRNYWGFYKDGVYLLSPYRSNRGEKRHHYRFRNYKSHKTLEFKRLPKRWIKEFDEL